MVPVSYQESQILLVIALLMFGAYKLPELARGLAEAVSEFSLAVPIREDEFARLRRAVAVLACLLALTALATLARGLDEVGRDIERSLSALTGTWR